ncbi:MAG: NADP-dependent oxidoreductase [Dysgonamonadaceae bacterium]|nr:NADP-dependent oxidoreductase [Dysgonamonadaceae bacterium]MDD4727130.1 NADP-dependent oxidoreductase [Dysgonamonadaceae bacterium]
MEKMKAYVRINDIKQDVELANVPIPDIMADQVLIKVKAFGVGIHDRYFIPNPIDYPYVIGSEGAGVIKKLGESVIGFEIGDRVIFTTVLQPQGGSWAEYAVSKYTSLIRMPDEMTFAQGSAVPIAGKTAIESMRELNLNKGDHLFIAGASGAIGSLVIQLAASKGIHVSASASRGNHKYMESLGADKSIDYKDTDWINKIKTWSKGGVDAALAIQPGTGIHSLKVVKEGGKLITVSGDNVMTERNIEVKQMGHEEETRHKIIQMVSDIVEGKINLIIEDEYPFDDALKALEKTETRHARGKSVVIL